MTASALATAGGIVFGGTADRRFFALDNGNVLWETRLNGDISGAPVTFGFTEARGPFHRAKGNRPCSTCGRWIMVMV